MTFRVIDDVFNSFKIFCDFFTDSNKKEQDFGNRNKSRNKNPFFYALIHFPCDKS